MSKDTKEEVDEAEGGEEEQQKLNLEVSVTSPSVCQRHITVKIPRDDIDRYYDKAFSELMGTAVVPGFRAGRAPRKLIESRFRKDIGDQVKGNLLMDSMAQVTEEQNFAAISEPDFDPQAIEVPTDGDMKFEFDIEVRPDFDLPNWKDLKIERPTREFSEKDIDRRLESLIARYGRLVPKDGPAAPGDYISCNMKFKSGDAVLSHGEEEVIRIRPVLSFRDGKIEKFDKLMKDVKAGETRTGEAKLTDDAPNVELRGKSLTAEFEILEVKQLELPELTKEFLDEMGGFNDIAELREAVRDDLGRQLIYNQQKRARAQVAAALTESANWELPPALLKRQSQRELQRAVLELRRNGFSEEEIRAHANELTQNSASSTARALKEHFILERIAEEEKIEAESDDYQEEIDLIAQQSGESPRRVRARVEKQGLMDALRNQIIERKVLDLVLKQAKFTDVPFHLEGEETEALDQAAGGGEEEAIPEAQHPGDAEPLKSPTDHG